MKWSLFVAVVSVGCADEKQPCQDGYGRDQDDRCVPLNLDGEGDSGSAVNSVPTAPGIQILPAQPRANGADLVCAVVVESIDVDGDSVTYHFQWSNMSGDVEEGDTVAGSKLVEGETWTCRVTANDGQEDGPPAEASVDVAAGYTGWGEQNISLSESDYLFTGEGGNDAAGGYVSRAGDVDGDGKADILIGAYWNDDGGRNAGKAYLVLGASLGAERHIPLEEADWHFIGEAGVAEDEPPCAEGENGANDEPSLCGGDWAAHSVNTAGDVDGDGLDDIVVCGYRSDEPGYDAGKTYLIYGSSLTSGGGRLNLGDSDVQFLGENPLDRMGHSITSAGDMDGDGLDDVVMGAYGNSDAGTSAGKAYLVMSGSIGDEERFDLRDADFAWVGEAAGDQAGYITAAGGDVDGDGLDDMFLASLRNKEGGEGMSPSGEDGAGKIYVILGDDLSSLGTIANLADVDRTWLGEHGGDAVGYGTHGLGDADGDGLDDLITGSFGNDEAAENAGKVYVVLASSMQTPGVRNLGDADYGFVGEGEEHWAGFAASPAGDVDADGRADVLVGAFRYSIPEEELFDAGKTYLIRMGELAGSGTHELANADASWVGEQLSDTAGYKVSGVGDVNGDGLPDLLVGGWQGDLVLSPGKAWLILNP